MEENNSSSSSAGKIIGGIVAALVCCACVVILAAAGLIIFERQTISSDLTPNIPPTLDAGETAQPPIELTRPPVESVSPDTLQTLLTSDVPENDPYDHHFRCPVGLADDWSASHGLLFTSLKFVSFKGTAELYPQVRLFFSIHGSRFLLRQAPYFVEIDKIPLP